MAACRGKQQAIVRVLLSYKEVVASIDDQDDMGRTALMLAAKGGALDITAQLLQAGCNRHIHDRKGMSARDYAASHSYSVFMQYMAQTMIR